MQTDLQNKRTSLHVSITQEAKSALQQLADGRTKPDNRVFPSDIAREAIQEYLKNHGYPDMEISVDRGGNRRGKSSDSQSG